MDLSTLRRTAAEIAAAAVYELYPEVELLGGGETSTGFSYEFYFPHTVHTHIIEEKMRGIVQERRPIKTLEMVPVSAREYLKSKDLFERSNEIEDDGLVELIQIGEFIDLCPGPHLKNTFELAAFKIEAEALPEKVMRITGWCHNSKAEFKQFLKALSRYISPIDKGKRMGYWKDGIWFKEGLKAREELIQFLKVEWFQGALEVAGPADHDRDAVHRSFKEGKIAEIWSESPHETRIQISFFDKPEEELISFLQTIGKSLTILGFDHSNDPMGAEADYLVVDGLGRSQPIVLVKRGNKKGSSTGDLTITAVVETILFQMLEKNLMMVEFENK